MKNIFVGNLPFSASEEEIHDLFAEYGEVHRVSLIMDRDTGKPRGFGFVEMDTDGGSAAINALNGIQFQGRNLAVNEAREKGDQRGGGRRNGQDSRTRDY